MGISYMYRIVLDSNLILIYCAISMTWSRNPYISNPKKNSKDQAYFVYYYRADAKTGRLKRFRTRCKTRTQAEGVLKKYETQYSLSGYSSFLNDSDRVDFFSAKQLLQERFPEKRLSEIVTEWIAWQPLECDLTFSDIVEKYLKSESFIRKASRTKSNERPFFTRLKNSFGHKIAKHVTYDDLSQFLEERELKDGVGAVTRNNELRRIKALYSWACDKQRRESRLGENVTVDLRAKPEPQLDHPYYTVSQVEKIFKSAEDHDPALLPALALCYFSGIRPDKEIRRVSGSPMNVDLSKRIILLQRGQAKIKNQARRIEQMPDNLWQWLSVNLDDNGSPIIDVKNWDKRKRKVHRLAGVVQEDGRMPNSISRHTFASYAFKYSEIPVEELMKVMGHTTQDMTNRYTSNLIVEEEAKKYFEITPSKKRYEFGKSGTTISLADCDISVITKHILSGKSNKWIGQKFGVTEAAIRKFREKNYLTKWDILEAVSFDDTIDPAFLNRYGVSRKQLLAYCSTHFRNKSELEARRRLIRRRPFDGRKKFLGGSAVS